MSILAGGTDIPNTADIPESLGARAVPLSAARRRAWYLQARDREDTGLNIGLTLELSGPVVPGRLRAAVAQVLARHEVLRTIYRCDASGVPYGLVRERPTEFWTEHDLSGSVPAGRSRRVEVLARRAFARPFDLGEQTPVRIALIRTGAAHHVFVLVTHTICWDEHSWNIFRDEVGAAYAGAALPPAPSGPAPPDVEDAPDEESIEYWRRCLRPLPDAPALPGPSGAADLRPRRHARATHPVPRALADRITRFATEQDTSVFAVLLAVHQLLLHRYTGASNFLVAVATSHRTPPTARMIGYFGNTVLSRARPDQDHSVADHVARVTRDWARAARHGHIGIDRVVRELDPDRDRDRDGLAATVRTGFGTRMRPTGFILDGIDCAVVDPGITTTDLPLRVTAVSDGSDLSLEAAYWTDHLDTELVEQLLAHHVTLLAEAVSDPRRAVGRLELCAPEDRSRLLALSRGRVVEFAPCTVVDLFAHRVTITPAAVAVIAARAGRPDLELTYAELDARANRLAHWLLGKGIGPEDVVALSLPASPEFVVAVYAVLAAGAAYLPVDAHDAPARAALIRRDARPRMVLDAAGVAAAEADAATLPTHRPDDTERVRPLRPDNLAYLMYTSGSTGVPKGVPVSHAALAEHLRGFTAEWDLDASDRLLLSAPTGFDASLFDLFATMVVGACLVVPESPTFLAVPHLARLIAHHGITVLHVVPSLLSALLMLPEVSEWRSLRYVPVGGEPLAGEVADRFAGLLDAELRNHYGPTEAVVSSTHVRVEGPQGARIVALGTPNANVDVHVLDERLRPTPPGVTGEIYLGGGQLARGYHGGPGRTAEHFVADPFRRGGRLFRTGDLARRDRAGVIEFVGRTDTRICVRGHRVELGEVEAVVSAHPSVARCAAIAHADPALGTVPAVYVVPVDPAAFDLDLVRAHAREALPRYMRPAAFAVIDRIPSTPHGKLDRRALPEPVRGHANPYRAPLSATEVRVAAHFALLLGLDRVGADDCFFALGGHSLLAHRLLAGLRAEFGVDLDIRALFDDARVARVSAALEAGRGLGPDTFPDRVDARHWRMVGAWATGAPLSNVATVTALLDRAQRYPADRVALRCGTEQLTYGQFVAHSRHRADAVGSIPVRRLAALRRGEPVLVDGGAETIVIEPGALAAAVAARRAAHAGDGPRGAVRVIDGSWRSARTWVEILAAVAEGRTLVMATAPQRRTPQAFAALVAAHGAPEVSVDSPDLATAAHTASTREIVGNRWPAACSEAMSSPSTFCYQVPEYAGPAAYGTSALPGRIRPAPGARLLVLDDALQPLPPGVVGAIHVGGAALASGHRDACAAHRFVADPHLPGGRLFRTGDLGAWDREGRLILCPEGESVDAVAACDGIDGTRTSTHEATSCRD